jgi:hypothetical protein
LPVKELSPIKKHSKLILSILIPCNGDKKNRIAKNKNLIISKNLNEF